jgi:hypothetical protein
MDRQGVGSTLPQVLWKGWAFEKGPAKPTPDEKKKYFKLKKYF